MKNDDFLNLVVNQEKHLDTIFKNLVVSNSMSKEMCKFVKSEGTMRGIMYGSCKVHKQQVDDCLYFGQFYQLYRPLYISALRF